MVLALSVCGGDDDSGPDRQPSVSSEGQSDEQALEQLAVDLWDARESYDNGEPIERTIFGTRPYAFAAEKTDEQWLVTATLATEDVPGNKTC